MTAPIQNISVPAANDVAVSLNVDPHSSLDGTVYWRVYPQAFGIPDFESSPSALIEKSSGDGSITIEVPPALTVQIAAADTANLLRNYYHEASLVDPGGRVTTLNCGIITVTDTRYRQ